MATANSGTEKGAVAWLVGEENKGLACMFTMMNNARLAVGIQGVGDRRGRDTESHRLCKKNARRAGHRRTTSAGMSLIIEHPDIARMLLTMKALTQRFPCRSAYVCVPRRSTCRIAIQARRDIGRSAPPC